MPRACWAGSPVQPAWQCMGVTTASDELIDWNNKVMSFRSVGHQSITATLIRAPQQLFEEIMLSEGSACEVIWEAFFVFRGLNMTFDLCYPKYASLFCDGFGLTTRQTSKLHRQDLCHTGLDCLHFLRRASEMLLTAGDTFLTSPHKFCSFYFSSVS